MWLPQCSWTVLNEAKLALGFHWVKPWIKASGREVSIIANDHFLSCLWCFLLGPTPTYLCLAAKPRLLGEQQKQVPPLF